MDHELNRAVLEYIAPLSTEKRPIYLVGGAVRDSVLQRTAHDLDFTLPGPTRKLAKGMADAFHGGFYVLDDERDTTRVVLQSAAGERLLLDFASIRGPDLESDLRSRDFTINTLAYDVAHPDRLIDPLGGLADLRNHVIRACAPTSLQQDPARVLRAVRQALSLQFRIEPETLRLVREAAPLLKQISPERQRDELFRILAGRRVSQAVQILDQLGALEQVLPELPALKGVTQSAPHVADVWSHTLGVVSHLERLFEVLVGGYNEDAGADLIHGLAVLRLGRYREHLARHFERYEQVDRPVRALLFFAALYHDIAKPAARVEEPDGKVRFLGHPEDGAAVTARRARQLALSGDEASRAEKIVRQHMRVHFMASGPAAVDGPARRSIYRYFRDTGEAGVDICLLSLADMRATYEMTLPQADWLAELDVCRSLLEAYWENSQEVVSPPRLVTGSDVMHTFSLKPGPLIGKILEGVREAQAAGEIQTREEALAFARRIIEGINEPPIEEREEG